MTFNRARQASMVTNTAINDMAYPWPKLRSWKVMFYVSSITELAVVDDPFNT
jgi:hypothetical protein